MTLLLPVVIVAMAFHQQNPAPDGVGFAKLGLDLFRPGAGRRNTRQAVGSGAWT
jgi:hypothetical protein